MSCPRSANFDRKLPIKAAARRSCVTSPGMSARGSKTTLNRRSRWCLTAFINDAIPNATTLLTRLQRVSTQNVRCAVVGEEICPATKKRHLQAYVEFIPPGVTFHCLKSRVDPTIHAEVAKGPRATNWTYCTKDGKFIEYHQPSTTPTDVFWKKEKMGKQGARTDLITLREHFKAGGTLDQMVWDDTKIQLLTRDRVIPVIQAAVAKMKPLKETMTQVLVLWGPAGTGKSMWAQMNTDPLTTYCKDQRTEWWCGLQPEMTTLWIDELGPDTHIPLSTMKQILNAESPGIPINIKGVPTRTHIFHKIVITSNYSPLTGWYPRAADDSGLRRRVQNPTGSVSILRVDGPIWEMIPSLTWPPEQKLPDFLLLTRKPPCSGTQPAPLVIYSSDDEEAEPRPQKRSASTADLADTRAMVESEAEADATSDDDDYGDVFVTGNSELDHKRFDNEYAWQEFIES